MVRLLGLELQYYFQPLGSESVYLLLPKKAAVKSPVVFFFDPGCKARTRKLMRASHIAESSLGQL